MTKFANKSFSVAMGGSKAYAENYDRIFRGKTSEATGRWHWLEGDIAQCPSGHEFKCTAGQIREAKCPVCHEVWL
jgi:hypothetical protein